jgi:hypothetical protein
MAEHVERLYALSEYFVPSERLDVLKNTIREVCLLYT